MEITKTKVIKITFSEILQNIICDQEGYTVQQYEKFLERWDPNKNVQCSISIGNYDRGDKDFLENITIKLPIR